MIPYWFRTTCPNIQLETQAVMNYVDQAWSLGPEKVKGLALRFKKKTTKTVVFFLFHESYIWRRTVQTEERET